MNPTCRFGAAASQPTPFLPRPSFSSGAFASGNEQSAPWNVHRLLNTIESVRLANSVLAGSAFSAPPTREPLIRSTIKRTHVRYSRAANAIIERCQFPRQPFAPGNFRVHGDGHSKSRSHVPIGAPSSDFNSSLCFVLIRAPCTMRLVGAVTWL